MLPNALLWLSFGLCFISTRSVVFPRFSAVPPTGTTWLALDEDRNLFIAFDGFGRKLGEMVATGEEGSSLLSRDESSCTSLTTSDLIKLPGWNKLNDTAGTNFGVGPFNLVTNPPEFQNMTASVCISNDTIILSQATHPPCNTVDNSTADTSVGADGSVSLPSSPGSIFSASASVEQAASIVQGFQAAAPMQIPAADGSTWTILKTDFKNSADQSTSTTSNNQQEQPVSATSSPGTACHLNFKTTSCDVTAVGQVRYVASGYAWFNYLQVMQGHFKWALLIESVLSLDERSALMDFSTDIHVATNSNFVSACGPALASSSAPSQTGVSPSGTAPSSKSAVIGGAVGGSSAAVIIIVALVIFLRRRRKVKVVSERAAVPYTPVGQIPAPPPAWASSPPSEPTGSSSSATKSGKPSHKPMASSSSNTAGQSDRRVRDLQAEVTHLRRALEERDEPPPMYQPNKSAVT